jgi:hypothetical protein
LSHLSRFSLKRPDREGSDTPKAPRIPLKVPVLDRGCQPIYANPEEFLKKAQEVIVKLQEKFPDFEKSVIQRAAINNPLDPEKYHRGRLNNSEE